MHLADAPLPDDVVGGPPDAGEVDGAGVSKNLGVKIWFTQPGVIVIKLFFLANDNVQIS